MSDALTKTPPTALAINLPDVQSVVTITSDVLATRDRLLDKIHAVESVTTQAEFETATEAQAGATKFLASVEKQRLAFTRPLDAAKKKVIAAVDAAFAPLEAEKLRVQTLTSRYADEQRRAAAAEAQRLEAEHNDAIAKQVADNEAQAAAMREAFGDDAPEAVPPPVVEPPKPEPVVEQPRSYATNIRERVVFTVTEPDKVPSDFLMVDEREVRKWGAANEDRIREALKKNPPEQLVPGVTFAIETKTVGR